MFEKTIATLSHHQVLLNHDGDTDHEIVYLTFKACYEELNEAKGRINKFESKEKGIRPAVIRRIAGKLYGTCQKCNEDVETFEKYCHNCGQKIDWSEEIIE